MIAEAEDEKSSAFAVSQEDIDAVLVKGNSVANGKYRIYHQFQKQGDSKGNIEFLKKEYGTGGFFVDFSDGMEGYVWYSGKGISIDRGGISTEHDLVLSWSKAEKRLRELIKDNRYLNTKEKDHYADYLESVSAPQYEIDIQRKLKRQRLIEEKRELPPADKRDTLALRFSDFIRDLDGYEKSLLENVGRGDLADVTEGKMEQLFSEPATVQQLLEFLKLVQGKPAEGATMTKTEKPSVREELRKIKEGRKEQEADVSPAKEKSSDSAKKPPAGKTEHKQPQKRKRRPKSKGAR
ncbi:hypothetical protein AALB52_07200 [Lachnospiraceae bacterium 38-14]